MQNTKYQSLWDGTEAVVPFAALTPESVAAARASWVGAGGDCRGERAGLGITSIDCKVAPQDTNGALFVIELAIREKGGPARHLHYEQEEWFYVVEGEFVIEVGLERMRLRPGDSVLAPRRVPHVWAHVDDGPGRMVIVFTPAGKMEAFFRAAAKNNALPPPDPAWWRAYDMELLGPPLAVK
jgi:quercetin dioxygenase-like cupin family protein